MQKKFQILLHILGLTSLAVAVFLEVLIFMDIAVQGYFYAVHEGSRAILAFEILMTLIAIVYLSYTYNKVKNELAKI